MTEYGYKNIGYTVKEAYMFSLSMSMSMSMPMFMSKGDVGRFRMNFSVFLKLKHNSTVSDTEIDREYFFIIYKVLFLKNTVF